MVELVIVITRNGIGVVSTDQSLVLVGVQCKNSSSAAIVLRLYLMKHL